MVNKFYFLFIKYLELSLKTLNKNFHKERIS